MVIFCGNVRYTDQELDVEFIDTLASQTYKFILSLSFPKNSTAIFPGTWQGYPTTLQVHNWISKSKITSTELSISDVQSLIDRLVYDGKVIRLSKTAGADTFAMDSDVEEFVVEDGFSMYKAVKSPNFENAWTSLPCGQCPVFDVCQEGSLVSPSGCVYFREWLDL